MSEPVNPPSEAANRAAPFLSESVCRWRRVFPGHQQELSALRRWLSALLPECPARDDVLSVASELGSNAVAHTVSGQGGWFAVEVTWHPHAVLVAVADGGGPGEPRLIDDPNGEHGRGLRMVEALSARTGFIGDARGRLVWAEVPWAGRDPQVPQASRDPYQESVREGEEALARRFAGVPAWFGRATLAWWAAGPQGLVSAPSALELAGLLYRLLDDPDSPGSQASRSARGASADQRARRFQDRSARAGGRDAGPLRARPVRARRHGTWSADVAAARPRWPVPIGFPGRDPADGRAGSASAPHRVSALAYLPRPGGPFPVGRPG